MFYVPPIVCAGYMFGLFYYVLPSDFSSFAIILKGRRELVALLYFFFLVSCDC